MARGGNKSDTATTPVARSQSDPDRSGENILYGETDPRKGSGDVRQLNALEELDTTYETMAASRDAVETAQEQLEVQSRQIRDDANRLSQAFEEHGDKFGAFFDSVVTNMSLDFFDYADHKPDCKRKPCSCGYEVAREYASRIYKQSTGEDPPASDTAT